MSDQPKSTFARRVRAAKQREKRYDIRDDVIPGLSLRVFPSGARSFALARMTRGRRQYATIGSADALTIPEARAEARRIIASFADTAKEDGGPRTPGRPVEAFAAELLDRQARHWKPRTLESNAYMVRKYILPAFGHMTVDAIAVEHVKDWFASMAATPGSANRAMSLLRSLYRKPCSDIESLHNPVSLWLDGGGRFHSKPRRQISSPSDVLPRWRAGIEAEVDNAVIRHALWLAMFTGLLREEVLSLNWEHVDTDARTFRVRHARGTLSAELPVTAQLAAILDRRHAECGRPEPGRRAWEFPSQTSASGHLRETKHLYAPISETGGVKFWFQGMRNCYLAVAERELLLPSSLTSRLLNRAPVGREPDHLAKQIGVGTLLQKPAQGHHVSGGHRGIPPVGWTLQAQP